MLVPVGSPPVGIPRYIPDPYWACQTSNHSKSRMIDLHHKSTRCCVGVLEGFAHRPYRGDWHSCCLESTNPQGRRRSCENLIED